MWYHNFLLSLLNGKKGRYNNAILAEEPVLSRLLISQITLFSNWSSDFVTIYFKWRISLFMFIFLLFFTSKCILKKIIVCVSSFSLDFREILPFSHNIIWQHCMKQVIVCLLSFALERRKFVPTLMTWKSLIIDGYCHLKFNHDTEFKKLLLKWARLKVFM